MAKKNVGAAVPDAAQNAQIPHDEYQDLMEPDPFTESAEGSEKAADGVGPDALERGLAAEAGALKEQDDSELEEAEFIEYAVSGCKRLRLRREPSTDAPVAAILPCGIGVLGSDRPAVDGWRQVFTGRLFGWVMDQYLEPLELAGDYADG